MLRRISLLGALLILGWGGGPAAAWDRPVFDFRGQLPVPGGTLSLEARCAEGGDALRCWAESRGPSGRHFQFEGRLFFPPRPPATPEPPVTTQNLPRWF